MNKMNVFCCPHVHRLSYAILAGTVLLPVLFVTGCVAPRIINKGDFDRLTQRQGMGHFYYIGSDAGFHYFASSYFTERTGFYRYPKTDYLITSTFPKTKQESQWIPFLFDLNTNTKGFKGEPRQPIK
ncbi:MAG: hypothetical protein M9920_12475 [Verrucomicrobiae bacterium]|nr:hypothetical protein [Verrucomicrobiae bacterium]